MFTCYEGNKKCQASEMKNIHPSWEKASFETEEEAIRYMHKWLGIYSPGIQNLGVGKNYELYDVIFHIEKEEL